MLGSNLDYLWLLLLGAVVIVITKYLLIQGVQWTSDAWKMPRKVQGQVLGYATSIPELVATVSTASKGLIGAGLWNVAASNIINMVLFISGAIFYSRYGKLRNRDFADEISFALGAIVLPLLLVTRKEWAESPWIALLLFIFFVIYLVADRILNHSVEEQEVDNPERNRSNGKKGILFILFGIIGIIVAGNYLGIVAESIVNTLKVPQWAVGWILGFMTSLPELTSFYAVFAAAKSSPEDADCQQNLDNLAASNMSNVGLIYPIGIIVFIFATR
jgi:cation:H+ antiporter